jgi:Chromo (CHRromatin Organisation MOdifier) domain
MNQKACSAKFYPRYIGPFKILEARPGTSSYKLELPPEYAIRRSFMHRAYDPTFPNDPALFPQREPPRPPPAITESEEYEVEKIVDHRETRRRKQYKVQCWLGYPDSDDEWVHEGYVQAPELIEDCWNRVQEESA